MKHYLLRKQPAALMTEIYDCNTLSYYITGRIGRYGDQVFLDTPTRGIVATMTDHNPQFCIFSQQPSFTIRKETPLIYYSPSHQWYMVGNKQDGHFNIYHHFKKIAQLYRPDARNLDVYAFDIDENQASDASLLVAYLLCQQVSIRKPQTHHLPVKSRGAMVSLYQETLYVVNDHNRDH